MDLDAIEEDNFAVVEPQAEESSQNETHKLAQLRPSLLTAVSELIATFDEKYPTVPTPSALHPFSPTPPDTDILDSIIQVAGAITTSLASHVPATDPRFVTRAQEYTSHADTWLQVNSCRITCAFQLLTSLSL